MRRRTDLIGELVRRVPLLSLLTFSVLQGQAQTPIVTAQFNNFRTGANLTESVLNTSNVKSSLFGKIRTFQVDGQVYAQPLYVPKVSINGTQRNVLYIATMHNSVYAFDANDGTPIFHVSLGDPVPASSGNDPSLPCPDSITTGPELGVLSTPVIDQASNSLYVVWATPVGGGHYVHNLSAIDITNGQIKRGPVAINPTAPTTGPNGSDDRQGGVVVMNQTRYLQRPGLLLSNGSVYAGFGGCGPDPIPYHGWVVGFDTNTLQQTTVFNASPSGSEAAIWQSGRGLVGDAAGNIFALTGNGTNNGTTDFADSFIKLSTGLTVLDWFRPANWPVLEQYDLDPSSSGPILTPDTNVLVGGGKDGIVYVLDPASLGRGPVQQFQAAHACDNPAFNQCYQIHSIAYLGGIANPMLYLWASHDELRSFRWDPGTRTFGAAATNSILAGYPGGTLAVSSQGGASNSSILWAVDTNGVVHAYDAFNVVNDIWNSSQNPSDALGAFSKFGQPVVADGTLFVPTFSGTVVAYGLLPQNQTGGSGQPNPPPPSPPDTNPPDGSGQPNPPPSPPIVDTNPPTVTCSSNVTSIWPPNGKTVNVTVSGTPVDRSGSGLQPVATWTTSDEYNQGRPSGSVSVVSGRMFSFSVPLVAARNGNDSDGRQYSVSVAVHDSAGKLGSCLVPVAVPHDQGH